jgi:hypothetical protein
MVSITSVISLFVLLAACCYSLPVEDHFQTSTYPTSDFEFTTGTTIVSHDHIITMRLMTDEESTGVPEVHIPRFFNEHEHFEYTTPESELHESVSRPPRMYDDMLFTTESSLSDLTRHERFEDSMVDTTTMETYTQPRGKQTKKYTSRFADKKVDMETATNTEFYPTTPVVEHEFQTSGDSFGKFTGLLNDDRTQETSTEMSSEMNYEKSSESEQDDQSKDEITYSAPSKMVQRLTKTVSVVPGKLTETQTFTDSRSKSYSMNKPELTQGENKSDI